MPVEEPKHEPKPDQSNGTNGEHPPRFAVGLPIPWFARQKIIEHDTLLDLRYLCRGGGMLIVAPSGQGKSTLSIQLAILWSCGREAFGITCNRTMRILIIQAEDDQGDCTEMSEMLFQFGLDPDELQMVEDNTELIRCNDLTNSQFAEALETKLKECRNAHAKIDLVIINPYSTYLGEDVQNSRANIHFLNELINPILSYFEVGLVVIHHTPKTNFVDFDKMKLWDWQYAGAGSFCSNRVGSGHPGCRTSNRGNLHVRSRQTRQAPSWVGFHNSLLQAFRTRQTVAMARCHRPGKR